MPSDPARSRPSGRAKRLSRINAGAPSHGRIEHVETVPFGASLAIERFRMDNGLSILVCEDHSAPIVAYHTWFRVGSRHEREGKTGLAHLFEHLMFNEVEGRPAGAFDRLLEEAGAESNASTSPGSTRKPRILTCWSLRPRNSTQPSGRKRARSPVW